MEAWPLTLLIILLFVIMKLTLFLILHCLAIVCFICRPSDGETSVLLNATNVFHICLLLHDYKYILSFYIFHLDHFAEGK